MNLKCPICEKKLNRVNKSFICENNHTFDIAKQGYVNLLIKQSVNHGDNTEMVKARTDFLNTDAYGFLRDKLAELVDKYHIDSLADLGCGEGYYTSKIPSSIKYGFDLSKDALKHASKSDKTTQYIVASIFHLPLEDKCVDGCLTCFAPASNDEIIRVLKDNGYFIFVTPGEDHLFEMKETLYNTPYKNELEDLDISLKLVEDITIENKFECKVEDLLNLFLMTPYAYKTSITGKNKLIASGGLNITAQFRIRVYKKEVVSY